MKNSIILTTGFALLLCLAGTANSETLALLCAESDTTCQNAVSQFEATGDFSSVVGFDTASTPTLSDISGFDAVLEWTNNIPADPTALGDLLESYYALGGKALTVATYSFSDPYAIGGAITTGGYAGLTDSGTNTDALSGNLVAVVPSDPIFNRIDLSTLTYFHNGNFADPGLASGATLLATDGAGIDMIARSSLGVVDVNLYPGDLGNNSEFYDLLANTLLEAPTPTPEPKTIALLGAGFLAMILANARRRKRAES